MKNRLSSYDHYTDLELDELVLSAFAHRVPQLHRATSACYSKRDNLRDEYSKCIPRNFTISKLDTMRDLLESGKTIIETADITKTPIESLRFKLYQLILCVGWRSNKEITAKPFKKLRRDDMEFNITNMIIMGWTRHRIATTLNIRSEDIPIGRSGVLVI